jgi:glycerol kinase
MAASDWTLQCLADILAAPIERPRLAETTALGVAWLAGHRAGVCGDRDAFAKLWQLDRAFYPQLAATAREKKYADWQRAVRCVLDFAAA